MKLRQNPYDVHIATQDVAGLCATIARFAEGRSPLILTNKRIAPLHVPPLIKGLRRHRLKAPILALPDGERYKTLGTVSKCYDWLIKQGADRESILVLVGGGVLGDLGGFAASTFMRGIRFIQVPTTLVAQVDSSIGGKVGVDHALGKNLIGSFCQPLYVHVDVAYLKTLPEREFRCGMAEVIKYAVIKDPSLFRFLHADRERVLRRESEALEHIVSTCCAIKARVVERDEKESSGVRMILNFGHTVGHVIEHRTGYKRYGHGEAVAMGMIAAADISTQLGYCKDDVVRRIRDMIAAYGLPISWPRATALQWERGLSRDKKMRGGTLNFVAVNRIGKVSIVPTTPKQLARYLVSP